MTEIKHDIAVWMDAVSDMEESEVLKGNALKVADGLLGLALRGDTAMFRATTKGIARFSGYSPSTTGTVTKAVDMLVEMGLVERTKGHGNRPSTYRLVVPSTTARESAKPERHDHSGRVSGPLSEAQRNGHPQE